MILYRGIQFTINILCRRTGGSGRGVGVVGHGRLTSHRQLGTAIRITGARSSTAPGVGRKRGSGGMNRTPPSVVRRQRHVAISNPMEQAGDCLSPSLSKAVPAATPRCLRVHGRRSPGPRPSRVHKRGCLTEPRCVDRRGRRSDLDPGLAESVRIGPTPGHDGRTCSTRSASGIDSPANAVDVGQKEAKRVAHPCERPFPAVAVAAGRRDPRQTASVPVWSMIAWEIDPIPYILYRISLYRTAEGPSQFDGDVHRRGCRNPAYRPPSVKN